MDMFLVHLLLNSVGLVPESLTMYKSLSEVTSSPKTSRITIVNKYFSQRGPQLYYDKQFTTNAIISHKLNIVN